MERTAKNLSPTNAACAEAKPSRNFKAPAPPPLFGSYDTVVRWPSRMGGGEEAQPARVACAAPSAANPANALNPLMPRVEYMQREVHLPRNGAFLKILAKS